MVDVNTNRMNFTVQSILPCLQFLTSQADKRKYYQPANTYQVPSLQQEYAKFAKKQVLVKLDNASLQSNQFAKKLLFLQCKIYISLFSFLRIAVS